jgi:hypothetical protein
MSFESNYFFISTLFASSFSLYFFVSNLRRVVHNNYNEIDLLKIKVNRLIYFNEELLTKIERLTKNFHNLETQFENEKNNTNIKATQSDKIVSTDELEEILINKYKSLIVELHNSDSNEINEHQNKYDESEDLEIVSPVLENPIVKSNSWFQKIYF